MGIVHGLLASLSIGLADLFGRRVANERGPIVVGTAIQFVAVFASLAAVLVVDSTFRSADLGLGLVSGLGLACGLWGYFAGLERASSAVIAPLVATLSAFIPYVWALVRGASPTALAVSGAVVALVGIVLVTVGGGPLVGLVPGLRWGLFSGVGFGVGLSVVIDVDAASGAWPAVGQRLGALALMLLLVGHRRLDPIPPRGLRTPALLSGAAAGASTVFYLLGVQADATSAVVTSQLFPAITVLVGHVVYDDEVRPRQILGIGVAILGVVLLALG